MSFFAKCLRLFEQETKSTLTKKEHSDGGEKKEKFIADIRDFLVT